MTNAFTWGFDGWIYACHGFANDSKVQGSDHRPITMNSGNTYRMRPDGSHAEYFTHGQVNPFGLAFDPLGNLYSCDCHSRPVYQLLRGACIPSFGKPDDGLGFGPEMVTPRPRLDRHRRHQLLRGRPVPRGVSRHDLHRQRRHQPDQPRPDRVARLDPQGDRTARLRLERGQLVPPGDIELGPDGALYVADFYNRIIGHYEVALTHPGRDRDRGRIWRIVLPGNRRQAAALPLDDRSDQVLSRRLIADLGHPNLAVRIAAANQLVEHAGRVRTSSPRSAIMRHEHPPASPSMASGSCNVSAP